MPPLAFEERWVPQAPSRSNLLKQNTFLVWLQLFVASLSNLTLVEEVMK